MSGSIESKVQDGATARALAPDLARGVMLLIIATVHALMHRQIVGPGPESGTDAVVVLLMELFAENRGYPMFAALFGYGLAQIYVRALAANSPSPLQSIRLRGRWLMAIGLAHTVLLAYGDILSVYGLAALLFAGLVAASNGRIAATGLIALVGGSLVYTVAMRALFAAADTGAVETTLLSDALLRLASWPVSLLGLLSISIFPLTVGILAGRRRMLHDVGRYRPLLSAVAVGGIAIAVLGGLPHGLTVAGIWQTAGLAEMPAAWLHLVSGYAGGFGYAALIALVADRVGSRCGPIVAALAATGRASMTCYLLQSVAWAVLFMPYTLDLAGRVSHAQAVVIGATVWLATVVLADGLQRMGLTPPAESFLRQRLHGRKAQSVDASH